MSVLQGNRLLAMMNPVSGGFVRASRGSKLGTGNAFSLEDVN